jgi:hypothetical protein
MENEQLFFKEVSMENGRPFVELTDYDVHKANRQVYIRQKPKRDAFVPSQRVTNTHSEISIDFFGALAEIAVSKLLHISIDEKMILGGDGGYDFVWMGVKIDVKYTYHKDGHLIVMSKDKLLADIYILLVGDSKRMDIIGLATKELFLEKGQFKDFGYGPVFAMAQDDLIGWESLTRLRNIE